jgi:triosephosphate isomerase
MSKTIIANWKMNLSVAQSLQFIKKIAKTKNEVVIAAPFTFLCELNKRLKNKRIKLAGQNVSQFQSGAYTGDVSAKMLEEEGCAFCLVGHSERRIFFKETDTEINKKIIEAHTFIREILARINKKQAKSVKILYGGTVNPENSQQILSLKQVNGALVGGASLKISSFNVIIKSS